MNSATVRTCLDLALRARDMSGEEVVACVVTRNGAVAAATGEVAPNAGSSDTAASPAREQRSTEPPHPSGCVELPETRSDGIGNQDTLANVMLETSLFIEYSAQRMLQTSLSEA